jgi:hypothetical protein
MLPNVTSYVGHAKISLLGLINFSEATRKVTKGGERELNKISSKTAVAQTSGGSSLRNDLGRTYTIKFWLTNDNMHVKGQKL